MLERLFGLPIAIVDIEASRAGIGCVFAETLQGVQPTKRREVQAVDLNALQEGELSATERRAVEALCDCRSARRGPFFRSGWLEDAVHWVRRVTGDIHGSAEIAQFNASGFTALACISFPQSTYWLKAIAPQVNSEYRFTKDLARLFPQFLPVVVSFHDKWHAILMQGGGTALAQQQCTLEAVNAVGLSLAKLQLASVRHAKQLLASGMADLRAETISTQIRASLPVMESSVDVQDLGSPRISRRRLEEMCDEVERLCEVLEGLNIPDTLLHNDLHGENIVLDGRRCAFIDWANPAIGNPLLGYYQVRTEFLHHPRLYARLSVAYKTALGEIVASHRLDLAVALLPGFAAAAELHQCLVGAGITRQMDYRSARRIRSLIRYLVRTLETTDDGYHRRYA